MDELIEGNMREAEIDFIPLPMIACDARQYLGAKTTDEARKLSIEIVKRLYERGLRPGDYDLGPELDYWPDEGCRAMLERIEREWIAAGADPNLEFPICWFGLPKP
jgi:hypothetical protein